MLIVGIIRNIKPAKLQSFLMLQQAVHIVTSRLEEVQLSPWSFHQTTETNNKQITEQTLEKGRGGACTALLAFQLS
jgi:hypothetical protein